MDLVSLIPPLVIAGASVSLPIEDANLTIQNNSEIAYSIESDSRFIIRDGFGTELWIKPENTSGAVIVEPGNVSTMKADGAVVYDRRDRKWRVLKIVDGARFVIAPDQSVKIDVLGGAMDPFSFDVPIIGDVQIFAPVTRGILAYGVSSIREQTGTTTPDVPADDGWRAVHDEADFRNRLERYENGERHPGERPRRIDEIEDPF